MSRPCFRILVLVFEAIIIFMLAGKSSTASDAIYTMDFSGELHSISRMCEDNGVLYFLDISASNEINLCALPLDTKEILWRLDINSNVVVASGVIIYSPVIDEEGLIHIYSNGNKEAYTITPDGAIIDTTKISLNRPPYDRVLWENGTIGWSYAEYGYTHEADAIGYGGMIISGNEAIDLFNTVQWNNSDFAYKPPVIDKNGTIYYLTASKELKCISRNGELVWMDKPSLQPNGHVFCTAPVIGSDGSIYIGTEQNSIYRYSPTGSPDSTGVILDIYEGDPDIQYNYNPLMIVQDSLLCWQRKDVIEVFSIPSKGYQEGAFWPCTGHDNHRSFKTQAPAFYPVSGQVLWNGTPREGAVIAIAGTDSTWTTDESGAFSISLPYGTYTLELMGTDVTQVINIDDAPVTDVLFESAEKYPFAWQSNVYVINYPYILPRQLAIDHGGNVLVGVEYRYLGNGRPGALISIAPNGVHNWSFREPVISPPVVATDNTIIVCQGEDYSISYGYVYRYQNAGTWARETLFWEETSYPAAVGSDGIVYMHTPSIGIAGYDQSGSVVWQSEVNVAGAPVIDRDGIIYVAADSTIIALNTNGSERWTYTAGGTLGEVVLGDGCIYAGCDDRTIVSLSNDGSVKRVYYLGTRPSSPPAVDSDGTLYVCTRNGSLYALDADGSVKWKTVLGYAVYTTPIIAANGVIFTATDNTVYAIGSNGDIEWEYTIPLERMFYDYPDSDIYLALDDSGMLYCLSSRVEYLYAFQTDTSGLKTDAPWPCYRGNNQRTGRISDDFVLTVENEDTPQKFSLFANYPNPFNPTTTISFTLPESGMVRLAVYSVSGQKVATLVDDMLDAGAHNMVFDGTGLASGIYVYRLEAEGNMQTGKMLLMK